MEIYSNKKEINLKFCNKMKKLQNKLSKRHSYYKIFQNINYNLNYFF